MPLKEPEQSADSQKPSPAGREYSITFYWGPEYKDFTAAEVTRMKEAGFDVATRSTTFPRGDMSDGEVHYEHLHECVTLLGQQGLNASVNDGRLTQVLANPHRHKGGDRKGGEADRRGLEGV